MDCGAEVLPKVKPIFHILVVGFHHHKGCTVEYAHPPLPSKSECSSLTFQLPYEWRHLPHLALPDGCHNYEEDSSFFVLPTGEQAVYGVACCRQIDSKEVKPCTDVTRSTVQKSVCILSKYPFYGSIEAKLNQITQAYFNAKDFSEVSILQEALLNLNSSFCQSKISSEGLQVGLSQQSQVLKLSHHLLQIFKALLLQKRVLVCGVPTNEVCKTVLGIFSLFPKSMESFVKPEDKIIDEYGFPLQVFTSPFSVQPYICLQQMDLLADNSLSILVGVANPLFQKQHSKFCDVYVNMEDGLLDVKDPTLRATLYLTVADLRFCDYVCRSVEEVISSKSDLNPDATSMEWFGSNGWIRSQFKFYLLSLLSTSLSNIEESKAAFGHAFMDDWLKSSVFINWKLSSKKYTGMSRIEPVHLCQGELTFSDLKLRLSAQASDYKLSKEVVDQVLSQTQRAVENVGGVMGSVWNAASSAVSSWWSGNDEDQN